MSPQSSGMPRSQSGHSRHEHEDEHVQGLVEAFPGSQWLVSQAALAQYNLRNFDEAQALLEDVLARDPHRIEVRCLCPHHDCLQTGCF